MQKEWSIGDLGKVLKLLSYFIGSFARILACILYFAPFLGILNILLPYSIDKKISYNQHVFNSSLIEEMSELTWYTGTDLRTAFLLFLSFPILHLIGIFLSRGNLSMFVNIQMIKCSGFCSHCVGVFKIYRQIIHGLACLLAPELWQERIKFWIQKYLNEQYLCQDWDDRWESVKSRRLEKYFYQSQWSRARAEFRLLVMFYCVENIILSLPTIFTCSRLMQRHTIITPLPIELPIIITSYFIPFCLPGIQWYHDFLSYDYDYILIYQVCIVWLLLSNINCFSSTIFMLIHGQDYWYKKPQKQWMILMMSKRK